MWERLIVLHPRSWCYPQSTSWLANLIASDHKLASTPLAGHPNMPAHQGSGLVSYTAGRMRSFLGDSCQQQPMPLWAGDAPDERRRLGKLEGSTHRRDTV